MALNLGLMLEMDPQALTFTLASYMDAGTTNPQLMEWDTLRDVYSLAIMGNDRAFSMETNPIHPAYSACLIMR